MTALLVHPAVLAAIAYLAVTLLFQFRPFSTRAHGLDVLGIVPRWKFFIPQSGRFEVGIELRCGSDEGDLGAWMPVRIYPPRHALTWLWFPEQHRAAIVWLSAHRIAARVVGGNHAAAPETLAYRTLVRHLQRTAEAQRSAMFQFALVHPESGANSPADRTLFTSQMHAR
jgi:hypothetical protein